MTKRKATGVKDEDTTSEALSADDTATDTEDTIEDLHHTTQDEMRFINNLGTYQSHSAEYRCDSSRLLHVKNPLTKVGWLGAYIRSAALRREWGAVDERAVLKHATELLRSLLRKAQEAQRIRDLEDAQKKH